MIHKIQEMPGVEIERAVAVLSEQDQAALLGLRDMPDASFSLVRPITDPDTESLGEMQLDLAKIMAGHGGWSTWDSAGVKLPELAGPTYFDGDALAMAHGNPFERITPFGLAVKMCAALPETALQPARGAIDKVVGTTPSKRRIYTSLGVLCGVALEEYLAVDTASQYYLFAPGTVRNLPSRVPAPLAYIYEEKPGGARNSFVPTVSMKERIVQTAPQKSTVQLGPVRLAVHPAGTSPYVKIRG